jgi:hypothetical protein
VGFDLIIGADLLYTGADGSHPFALLSETFWNLSHHRSKLVLLSEARGTPRASALTWYDTLCNPAAQYIHVQLSQMRSCVR